MAGLAARFCTSGDMKSWALRAWRRARNPVRLMDGKVGLPWAERGKVSTTKFRNGSASNESLVRRGP